MMTIGSRQDPLGHHVRVIHLTAVELRRPDGETRSGFPYELPAVRSLTTLRFEAPVTIFVGENGSGKSTLLEALAIAARAITAGSAEAADDPTLAGVRSLADALRLSWAARTHRGFYLRAEDFFGFARRMAMMTAELERGLAEVDAEYAGRPGPAHDLARTPYLRELGALRRRYGEGLDSQSHGESFLRFFQERLVPGGTYFLDEPEAPLSPARQLAFLALLGQIVADGSQVIFATHSPILLSFPGAAIWSFDHDPIRPVAWDELEHVTLTRSFLNDPGAYLRHL
jgi:predicted ATPase